MPHGQANIKRCSSLDAAFAYLNGIHQKKQLWSVLKFDTDVNYYAFHSTDNFGQQMHGVARNIFEQSGHYGRGMPHGRELAMGLADNLVLGQSGQPHAWGGHAEEHLIQHFRAKLAACAALPRTVIIWNSDSPCRTADRRPSSNLAGWPASCTAKFRALATRYPTLQFMVYIKKGFGSLVGSGADAARTLNAEGNPGNLRFLGFTTELDYVVRQHGKL